IGNRFGFIVFDECHHLPATHYQRIALAAIAPFRLGLTATLERADGRHEELDRLIGGLVYEGTINQMVTKVLAPYDVVSMRVRLSDAERRAYDQARAVYTSFLK